MSQHQDGSDGASFSDTFPLQIPYLQPFHIR
uniref:Uncharacterized protein n=1 Tax=Arundo donax TaxID=35708 RepID=A0A0A8XZH0_ARUDO